MSIVQGPVGHRSAGNAGMQQLGRFDHQHQGQVAAVAPAPYADARAVDERLRCKPARARDLVGYFDFAEFAVNGRLKSRAPKRGAAIVQLKYDIARASQDLRE